MQYTRHNKIRFILIKYQLQICSLGNNTSEISSPNNLDFKFTNQKSSGKKNI